MATRRDETDSVKKEAATPARKSAPAKKVAPRKKPAAKKAANASTAVQQTEEANPAPAKGLLRAGLKALGNVRDDVVKHQTNVIESLLGIGIAQRICAPEIDLE